ncbi:homing endonuclease [Acinetobacter phage vB_AbaP_B1]|uniref:Homing endonuclease n=2 Tax=Friunavirus TaxID=1985711 RepID=A0A221SBG3_9CAUD|nr:endonuclease [Acinetobacter phage vB_AbaP_B1]YP_009610416.1 HNH endonuclease [Acinetobacter phage vB_AbaP_B5]ASN73336.1 homing endonuclease [Acinetobacter phage vB_AbaP_B1]ASN73438.1 homing endonuclease [Acinetobacter phage vB_AbaP_B5]
MKTPCIDHGRRGNRDGYTMCKVTGVTRLMHRVVYCDHNKVPYDSIKGLLIRHKCDNPRCINPEHLETGTAQDNSNDMVSRNRQAKGLKHGMTKLTVEQVKYIRANYKAWCPENGAKALGLKFNVSPTTIRLVHKGLNWKCIGEYA